MNLKKGITINEEIESEKEKILQYMKEDPEKLLDGITHTMVILTTRSFIRGLIMGFIAAMIVAILIALIAT